MQVLSWRVLSILPWSPCTRTRRGLTGYITDLPTAQRLGTSDEDSVVYVVKDPAVPADVVEAAIATAVEPFPNVQVLDQSAFKSSISDQIGQLLNFPFALLVLARSDRSAGHREHPCAERLGTDARNRVAARGRHVARRIRRTIVIEAFIIAVLGAVLGMVVGSRSVHYCSASWPVKGSRSSR